MTLQKRISAFENLGKILQNLTSIEFHELTENVKNENPWFVEQNVRLAMEGVGNFLSPTALLSWVSQYNFSENAKTIALIMAGNIPMVGFHDLLAVLISGHSAQIKLSSKDSVLMKYIIEKLVVAEPLFSSRIAIVDRLKNFDAVIATGSDNSARYFEFYFGKYPNIIRKNRTSVAVITNKESKAELTALGKDVFTYFGLGCRNVSKIFIPEGYKLDPVFESWTSFENIIHHHKYCNNYDYQKSLMLVNSVPFLDNGFVMLHETERIVSPISVVYYSFYKDEADLKKQLEGHAEKIQVITGNANSNYVPFGKAQSPGLSDYADNVDTLKFLGNV